MLDLDPGRQGVTPRDASTLVAVRDGDGGLEVFCVERQKVGFLGGAVVFPGGKLDPADMDPAWAERSTALAPRTTALAGDAATVRGLAVAACREALEEAAILPVSGAALGHAERLDWRARVARHETTLLALLGEHAAKLDLAALLPLSRWVTPVAEARRFDARFFLYVANASMTGAHDDHETTASFWSPPAQVLSRFLAGELQLAPPTHRTLETLAAARDTAQARALAEASCLDPVCPRLVPHKDARGDAVALVLPGDPEHEVREPRSPGKSRYVLRGDRFLPEDAPA